MTTILHIVRGLWAVKNAQGGVCSYTCNERDARIMRRQFQKAARERAQRIRAARIGGTSNG